MSTTARRRTSPSPSAPAPEVFLSPRVVDRTAFNDFAEQLRSLIASAHAGAGALQSACNDARDAHSSLQKAVATSQPAADTAVRALAEIDQRAEEVRSLLETVVGAAERLETANRDAGDLVQRQLVELREQLARNEAEHAARIESLAAHAQERFATMAAEFALALAETRARVEAETRRTGPTALELNAMLDRAESLMSRKPGRPGAESLTAVVERAETLCTSSAKITQDLQAATRQAELATGSLSGLTERSAAVVNRFTSASEQIGSSLNQSLAACASAQSDLQRRREELDESFRRPLAELEEIGESLHQRLSAMLGQVQAAQSATITITADTDAVLARLGTLVEDLRPWRPLLIERRPGELPGPLQDMVQAVRTDLGHDLAQIASGMSQITLRATRLAEAVAPKP